MNRDRVKAAALIRKVSDFRSEGQTGRRNVKAIILTVDAPAAGKREADEKVKAEVVLVRPPFTLRWRLYWLTKSGI